MKCLICNKIFNANSSLQEINIHLATHDSENQKIRSNGTNICNINKDTIEPRAIKCCINGFSEVIKTFKAYRIHVRKDHIFQLKDYAIACMGCCFYL